jgi:hypothetical protein
LSDLHNLGGVNFILEVREKLDKPTGKMRIAGTKIIYKNESKDYTNVGTERKDPVAKSIRTFFQTDNLPNKDNEREFETLKKIEDYRTAKNISTQQLAEMISKAVGHKEKTLGKTSLTAIKKRLDALYRIADLIFPIINKEEKKITTRKIEQTRETTTDTREEFEKDHKIIEWMNNANTGIANKSTKARAGTVGALYKVFQLLKLDGSFEFALAGGHEDPQAKTDWLKNQYEKIVKPYYLSEWALDPTDNKFKQKSKSWKGGIGSYYKAVMAGRSFAAFMGFPLAKIKNREDALYAGVRSHGLHDQIEIPIDDITIIETELKKLCQKEGNMDAYMYFMVGMATGMRKVEGLTIPLSEEYIIEMGKFDEKAGKEFEGLPFYKLRLFNRKILHTVDDKQKAYTTSIVYNPVTCKLIYDRLNSKEAQKQGLLIGSLNKGDKNNFIKPATKFTAGTPARRKAAENSPLGVDVWLRDNPEISYRELPTHEENPADNQGNIDRELYKPLRDAYLKVKNPPLIRELTDAENVVEIKEAIFSYKGEEFKVDEWNEIPEEKQKQYIEDGGTWLPKKVMREDNPDEPLTRKMFDSGYDERSYFWMKPLHSVRHAFAQFWLQNSEYNFAWVAEHGHWKTIEELKKSYGGIPPKQFIKNSLEFVEQAEKSQNRSLGINKADFDRAAKEQKAADQALEDAEKAAEEDENAEDENE